MNTMINDKTLSLATQPNSAKGEGLSKAPNSREETEAPSAGANIGKEDNLEISRTGQLLHQAATEKTDAAQSAPETAAQTKALAAKIRQQLELNGTDALSAHSAIKGSQTDLLLRSAAI